MAKALDIQELNPKLSIEVAAWLVLVARWEEMCTYAADTARDPTVKAIHDLRVAARRLRGAYRDFRPYVRTRRLHGAMKGVREIADRSGLVRDEDVAIATLDKLAEGLTDGMRRHGIQLLKAERVAVRNASVEALLSLITEERLTVLEQKFLDGVETVATEEQLQAGDAGSQSVTSAGKRIINNSFARLTKLSKGFYAPHRTRALHRLRIAAKRLRYAMQLFAVCWGDELNATAKEVAKLQDALGELHDCDVWIAGLGKRLKKFNEQPAAETTEIERSLNVAAIWLLGRFTRDRAKHFRDALDLWHRWDSDDFGGRLGRLLDSDGN